VGWPARLLGAVLGGLAVGTTAPVAAWLLLPDPSIPAILGIAAAAAGAGASAGMAWPLRLDRTGWLDRWMGAAGGAIIVPLLSILVSLAAGWPPITLRGLETAAVIGAVLGAIAPKPFGFLLSIIPFP